MKLGIKLTIVLLLFASAISLLFYLLERRSRENRFDLLAQEHAETLEKSFNRLVSHDTKTLSATLEIVLTDTALKTLFRKRQRDQLYRYVLPVFEILRDRHGITHFYFILPDGNVFLRMHNVGIYGDAVRRTSFIEARESKISGTEMELGKTAFALRYVRPVYTDGELIGYLELAEGITHFLDILQHDNGGQFAVFGEKEMVSRNDWASVRKVAGLRDNWGDLEKYLLFQNTDAYGTSARCFTESNLLRVDTGMTVLNPVREKGKSYLCVGFALKNVDGKPVGALLSLRDMSRHAAAYKKDTTLIVRSSAVLFVLIFFTGMLGSRIITKPLKTLVGITKKVGQGQLNHEIAIRSKDEIGELASAFNTMLEQRKEAENALFESESKYRDLFENANDAIYVVDSSLNYVDVNKKATELFGYSKGEYLNMNILDVIPPEQREQSETAFSKLRQHSPYDKFVGKMKTKEGRWRDVEVSSSPIVRDGRHVGSRDIVRDITDRKKMEEEILKKEKLKSLEILTGGIAHDFNNLLTGLLGNISLSRIHAGRSPEKTIKHLAEAENATLRAKDLTQQLMTFSRGGAPVKETVDMGRLIRELADFSLSGSNIICHYEIPSDLWPCEVDTSQMSQVVNNLVINAVQAMPAGGTLAIGAENLVMEERNGFSLPGGDYVKIRVRDEGIGIDPAHLNKIFDPYFTTKQQGSGLGLASAFSIMNKHGGHITLRSSLGEGTTFYLYIPASPNNPPPSSRAMNQQHRGSGKILVMDDEELVLTVTTDMLEEFGYDVTPVRDGTELIRRYKRAKETGAPFKAVIMDLTVPGGMGGLEAIRDLLHFDPDVKAIVSSGYSQDSAMARFEEYGFSGCVAKPYLPEELAKTLNSIFDQPPGSRTMES